MSPATDLVSFVSQHTDGLDRDIAIVTTGNCWSLIAVISRGARHVRRAAIRTIPNCWQATSRRYRVCLPWCAVEGKRTRPERVMNAARNSERSYARAPAARALAAEVTNLFCNLGRALFDPYRPERHYMRGPGLRLGNGSRRVPAATALDIDAARHGLVAGDNAGRESHLDGLPHRVRPGARPLLLDAVPVPVDAWHLWQVVIF